MSRKLIKSVLLVEDNLGDARLLREMLNEDGSGNTRLTQVECMTAAYRKQGLRHMVRIPSPQALARGPA